MIYYVTTSGLVVMDDDGGDRCERLAMMLSFLRGEWSNHDVVVVTLKAFVFHFLAFCGGCLVVGGVFRVSFVQQRERMEANFSLMSDGQLPAFRGLISRNRLTNVFRVDGEDFWEAVRLLFGEEFLTLDWGPRTNLDILSLFAALALQVGKSVEEVQRVTSLVLRPK